MKIKKSALFVKKKFEDKYAKDKYYKARDRCHYRRAAHSICNLKYSISK